jgi:hypothetical protein
MADSIPRAYLKELTDTLAAEPIKVAFFVNLTGYNALTATTYTILATTATEVSDSGTGYTLGGYSLILTSSNLTTNGAIVSAVAQSLVGKTFTFRYLVVYNSTTKKIRFVKDLLGDRVASSANINVTWSATDGIIKLSYE